MLFIANWKMHGNLPFAEQWCKQFSPPSQGEIAICPPFPYLQIVRQSLPSNIHVGAQDVATYSKEGAYTGEVSAQMLHDIGCTYALIGHSERRAMGCTDADCENKIQSALTSNIVPVLCIGESEAQYQNQQTADVLHTQMQPLVNALLALDDDDNSTAITNSKNTNNRIAVLAYEPIWAIGSGKTPAVDALAAVCELIHQRLNQELNAQNNRFSGKISVLYGGSINENNATLPQTSGMDGGLVGGASLDAVKFSQLCQLGQNQ